MPKVVLIPILDVLKPKFSEFSSYYKFSLSNWKFLRLLYAAYLLSPERVILKIRPLEVILAFSSVFSSITEIDI